MAHHQQHARPVRDRVVEQPAGPPVQVVGRLVEEGDRRRTQQQPGQPGQHHLAAGQGADAATQRVRHRQTEPVQSGDRAVLDIPVVADLGQQPGQFVLAEGSGLDPPDRVADAVDTQQVGHRSLLVEHQVLRQQPDIAGAADSSAGGSQPAGDESQQRRLAGPVRSDQAGAARIEGQIEVLERRGAVRPGKGQVGTDDGRGHEELRGIGNGNRFRSTGVVRCGEPQRTDNQVRPRSAPG